MRDYYSELASALGSDPMDSHEGRLNRARRARVALEGPQWCRACEGSGRMLVQVGGQRTAGDGICPTCAGIGRYLPVAEQSSTIACAHDLAAQLARARAALDELFDGPPEVWADWFARNKDVYKRGDE